MKNYTVFVCFLFMLLVTEMVVHTEAMPMAGYVNAGRCWTTRGCARRCVRLGYISGRCTFRKFRKACMCQSNQEGEPSGEGEGGFGGEGGQRGRGGGQGGFGGEGGQRGRGSGQGGFGGEGGHFGGEGGHRGGIN